MDDLKKTLDSMNMQMYEPLVECNPKVDPPFTLKVGSCTGSTGITYAILSMHAVWKGENVMNAIQLNPEQIGKLISYLSAIKNNT